MLTKNDTLTKENTAAVPDVQLARLRRALKDGGRASVTVRSSKTDRHVTIDLVCRKRDTAGKWISRATKAGQVGLFASDVIEARDPLRDGGDAYVGRLYRDNGKWRASADADKARIWTADRVITAALTGIPLAHEMFVADICAVCARPLTDPESIARGIGPDCAGRATGSQVA